MFNSATVTFPNASVDPGYVYSLTLRQRLYEHELITIVFKDWDIAYENIKSGSPIEVNLFGANSNRKFYGYVHHIEVDQKPGSNFTSIVGIGGSFPLKQATQDVYRKITANQVIEQIAEKHGLVAIATPHPRVFEQVSHAGQTDWQMCVRLAKQCGYTLRTENTEIYFQPMLDDYKTYRRTAQVFTRRGLADVNGSNLYSFKPTIGDSIAWDGEMKSAVAVSGIDQYSKEPLKSVKQQRNKKTKKKSELEFFDTFANVVAPTREIAEQEAEAAESRNSFPYRGTAEVLGEPTLRPNIPVYLDGLGSTYSGFWTVLGVDHHIVEEKTKFYKYTSTLHVGTDSLGLAERWDDANTITSPDSTRTRIVTPGKKETIKKAKTVMAKQGTRIGPQTKSTFGSIKNREKPTGAKITTSKWQTKSKNLKVSIAPIAKVKPKAVVDRLAKVKKI
jgi:phage protein D